MNEGLEALLGAIWNGHLDDDLDAIQKAILSRKKDLGRKLHTVDEFKVGMHVKVRDSVRPAYLAGLTGTIVKVNRTRVKLEFHSGQDTGRFDGKTTACPISLLEIIDKKPLGAVRKRGRRKLGE
jgi:hypothetical protein